MASITSVGRAAGLEPIEPSAGSQAAALYERHSTRVFGYCLSRLGRREDAEDAVQTTFLHAVRGLGRGVVPATEVAWLLGIARNVCLARWESVGRRNRLESPCDPVELDRGRAAPQGRHEELIGLEEALSQLPDQQRRAVLLRDWRGLSYEEIAAQLDVSLACVETLIFRGRRTLSELLREEPQATRRRLRSLGDLGSLLSAIKTAFTGAAAATKIATATVAAVALSGAGAVVVSDSLDTGQTAPVRARDTKLAPAGPPASVASRAASRERAESRADVAQPTVKPPAVPRLPATRSSAPSVGSAPTTAPTAPAANAPAAAAPAEDAAAATPAPSSSEPHAATQPSLLQPVPVAAAPVVAAPVEELLPAVTGVVETTIETTVETLLPNLPVEVPSLPLPPLPPLPPLVVPPVPVADVPLPVTVSVPPVEVSPPKLLP